MKKIVTILLLLVLCVQMNAQFADCEVLGFVDENNQVITSINLNGDEDFIPRVAIRKNGTGTIPVTDTLDILISLDDQFIGRTYLAGSSIADLNTGRVVYIGNHVLFTAEQLHEIVLPMFDLCYEVRYLYDTVPANNSACITISHPVGVGNFTQNKINIYPNPVSEMMTIDNLAGETVTIFDVMGRLMYQNTTAGFDVINVATWENGLYLVRLTKEGQAITRKVMVAH